MNLIINQPRKEDNKIISTIQYDSKSYDMFFEVEKEYSDYLNTDNANSFLIALLPFIVKHNYNIIIKSKISSKLYYQLNTYLIPMLCNAFNKEPINIECEITNTKYNSKGVGASISCGVDSFYTLLKHKNLKDKSKDITHLCFFNAGSNGEFGGEKAQQLFNDRVEHIREFCKEYKYSLVTVNSNMNELIMMNHEKRHTFTTLACVYALEKLFNTYYFASGLGFDGSHIDEDDTAFYDILNVKCLSNENITFYCSGIETTRMEKIKYISNFEETYNWLNVCVGNDWKNDGTCLKCIRTMTALESIDKLDKYRNVFDLDKYYKDRTKILASVISGNRNRIQHEFYSEIIDSYRNNKIKIPILAYILSFKISKNNIKSIIKKIIPKRILYKYKKNKVNDGWTD